jgi:dipeptidyl aminopeptidase/acylaminoacyl peptidase
MRKDVEFKTQNGVTLRGWHYLPDQRSRKVPTIVMAHGFSAVKEMYLDKFAEVFAEAGLGALVFDNRNFGASGGEPRQEIDPWPKSYMTPRFVWAAASFCAAALRNHFKASA